MTTQTTSRTLAVIQILVALALLIIAILQWMR